MLGLHVQPHARPPHTPRTAQTTCDFSTCPEPRGVGKDPAPGIPTAVTPSRILRCKTGDASFQNILGQPRRRASRSCTRGKQGPWLPRPCPDPLLSTPKPYRERRRGCERPSVAPALGTPSTLPARFAVLQGLEPVPRWETSPFLLPAWGQVGRGPPAHVSPLACPRPEPGAAGAELCRHRGRCFPHATSKSQLLCSVCQSKANSVLLPAGLCDAPTVPPPSSLEIATPCQK